MSVARHGDQRVSVLRNGDGDAILQTAQGKDVIVMRAGGRVAKARASNSWTDFLARSLGAQLRPYVRGVELPPLSSRWAIRIRLDDPGLAVHFEIETSWVEPGLASLGVPPNAVLTELTAEHAVFTSSDSAARVRFDRASGHLLDVSVRAANKGYAPVFAVANAELTPNDLELVPKITRISLVESLRVVRTAQLRVGAEMLIMLRDRVRDDEDIDLAQVGPAVGRGLYPPAVLKIIAGYGWRTVGPKVQEARHALESETDPDERRRLRLMLHANISRAADKAQRLVQTDLAMLKRRVLGTASSADLAPLFDGATADVCSNLKRLVGDAVPSR